jgi:hypothetical protein
MNKALFPMAVASTAVAAAALAVPAGSAYAATSSPPPAANQGNTSVGSGNQALISLNLPADICGLAVAVIGTAQSGCEGGAVAQTAPTGTGGSPSSPGSGNISVGSGNKVSVPVTAPVDVCGVSVALLGNAKSGCQGGATVTGAPPTHTPWPPSGPPVPAPKPPTPPKHHWHHRWHHKHHVCTTGGGGAKGNGGSHSGTSHTGTTQKSATLTSTGQADQTDQALGSLPTTGVNLAGILAGALGLLGTGAGILVAAARRRRASQAS